MVKLRMSKMRREFEGGINCRKGLEDYRIEQKVD